MLTFNNNPEPESMSSQVRLITDLYCGGVPKKVNENLKSIMEGLEGDELYFLRIDTQTPRGLLGKLTPNPEFGVIVDAENIAMIEGCLSTIRSWFTPTDQAVYERAVAQLAGREPIPAPGATGCGRADCVCRQEPDDEPEDLDSADTQEHDAELARENAGDAQ